MARVSIILIAVGVVLIPEAFSAPQGELGPSSSALKGSPESSPIFFSGEDRH